MTTNPIILDMLGEPLKGAILAAQARAGDETVMARIVEGLVEVERGEPAVILQAGLSVDDAVTYLGGVK